VPETNPGATQRRMERELSSLRMQSQYRTLHVPSGIDLSSNDYLGLATDPRFKRAVIEAVERCSTVGSTGSRLLSGNSREWEDLERVFADFAGTEAALYFSSGYAANIGLLTSLLKPGDVVFSDALNHASLIDGIRLSGARKVIYPHRNLQFLDDALRDHARSNASKVIVTESLFSMEGDIAPLAEMASMAQRYGAEIVVDEGHAVGVCGPRGRGIAAELGVERQMLAIVHTCGKALASAGAFVCGSETLRKYLINRARTFVFSTAMPPYLAGQLRAAMDLAREADGKRIHLRQISHGLRERLAEAGIHSDYGTSHIVPIILGTNEKAIHVACELQRNGFAVRAIRPPTVAPGTARIRVSLTSKITMDDVCRLVIATAAAILSRPSEIATSSVHA
jgi:8-amino-7-oxononanoate synthase